ncbi:MULTISPECIES: NETI motif-containing protein [Lysinibacillus]|uniref:NETI motif-containing protein n=1 Tax=Lysinibacillus pakistanensis TaxID=759811 RepID=A0AAX3WWI3_9BACI|nr:MULTISPECIES: NETI motif-containing protein [Lysinibacillus]MDM5230516.1 NETI motif-containing protein [Lysinibacillus pakistanensis]QGG53269.1 NETI motif-containing protein [Lysinibacillus pakistanensis]WHY46098.1 NETI motif-containing protein [Lysinibacillus pakistanensis]WHY51109.1 NETI motif-containing protein [Lysinibacillus pakistanensis]
MGKRQIWYEVEENESIEDCLARMRQDGFIAVGRKEEPIFHLVNGEPTYLRQKIQFKAMVYQDSE